MRSRFILCGVLFIALATLPAGVMAQVATYSYQMNDWVESSNNSTVYATVPSLNSIAVINMSNFQSTLIGIGSDPEGLALSADGSKLYVANHGSNFLGVLNTQTLTTLSPIPLGSGVTPFDVQVGNNNRLWVLTGGQNQGSSIIQVNAATGASTGSGIGAYGGKIRISSDGSSLYYGNFGLSPSNEDKFNVGGANPTTAWSDSLGGNGEDVALSKDGSLVSFPEGGNALNGIIQTSSNLTLGSVGPASSLAFSPDNQFAYTGIFFNTGISTYSLTSYLQTGTINTVGGPQKLFVDNTGAYIFSDEDQTRVYATGHAVVPEPASFTLLACSAIGLLARRRRKD